MLRLLVSLFVPLLVVSGDDVINDDIKSFSYSIKAARCMANNETVLYEHRTGPGVITEQWYTGKGCFDENTVVRYYIDGELKPSIEGNLFMLHGMGFFNATLPPWGTKWMGHVAKNGGLYNTFRIPFQKSIRVSFIPKASLYYWYIVRGAENMPIVVGDLRLPSNTRLVLYKNEDRIVPPLVYVPLVTTDRRGIVFSLSFRAEGENFEYLDGCFGSITTATDESTKVNMLSASTDSMFLSAHQFNKLFYQTDDSGLTYKNLVGSKFSAYKFFHQDPVIMESLFTLLWRSGENKGGCWLSKEEASKENNPDKYSAVKISSYVLTYEW